MDALISHLREGFAPFKHPTCLVLHGNECFDCPDVAAALANKDCELILSSDKLVFDVIPMDCLSADAILHYLPSIVKQAVHPKGVRVAETLAWILGADEWDTEFTISEQIKPKLNSQQLDLIRATLNRFGELPFSSDAAKHLRSAIRIWR